MSKQPPACEMLLPLQKREGFMGNRALHYHHTWNSAGLGLEQTSSPAFQEPCRSPPSRPGSLHTELGSASGICLSNVQEDSALVCKLMVINSPKSLVFLKISSGETAEPAVNSHLPPHGTGVSPVAVKMFLCTKTSQTQQYLVNNLKLIILMLQIPEFISF